jgi:hypothetical protein
MDGREVGAAMMCDVKCAPTCQPPNAARRKAPTQKAPTAKVNEKNIMFVHFLRVSMLSSCAHIHSVQKSFAYQPRALCSTRACRAPVGGKWPESRHYPGQCPGSSPPAGDRTAANRDSWAASAGPGVTNVTLTELGLRVGRRRPLGTS